jgi:hypothetical protein
MVSETYENTNQLLLRRARRLELTMLGWSVIDASSRYRTIS